MPAAATGVTRPHASRRRAIREMMPAATGVHARSLPACSECYVMSMGGMRRVLGVLAILGVCTAFAGGAGAASHAEAAPRVAVVRDLGRCPDAMTLRICEGFKQASRRTGVTGRIMTPTFKDALEDFLELIARQRYEAIVSFGL